MCSVYPVHSRAFRHRFIPPSRFFTSSASLRRSTLRLSHVFLIPCFYHFCFSLTLSKFHAKTIFSFPLGRPLPVLSLSLTASLFGRLFSSLLFFLIRPFTRVLNDTFDRHVSALRARRRDARQRDFALPPRLYRAEPCAAAAHCRSPAAASAGAATNASP